MSINAKVDSNTYNGIDTISVGGKTIELSESGSETIIVSDIPSEQTLLGTTTEEMTVSEFFNTFHLDCSRDGVYFVDFYGDEAPTGGIHTLLRLGASFNENYVQSGVDRPNFCVGMLAPSYGLYNKLDAPNTYRTFSTLTSFNTNGGISGTYVSRDTTTKYLVVNSNRDENFHIPANCTAKYTYLPINVLTCTKLG